MIVTVVAVGVVPVSGFVADELQHWLKEGPECQPYHLNHPWKGQGQWKRV